MSLLIETIFENVINMKKLVLALISICLLSSCTDKNLVTQKIASAADCDYCDTQWSWNSGVATVNKAFGSLDQMPAFYFTSSISGELRFCYKLNDSSYGNLRVTGATSFRDGYGGKRIWTQVKSGHVDIGERIVISGKECSIKDIVIIGDVEENKNENNNGPGQHWDF